MGTYIESFVPRSTLVKDPLFELTFQGGVHRGDDDCDRNGDGSAHVADLVQDASHNVEHDPLQMKIFFTFSDKNFLPKVTDLNL